MLSLGDFAPAAAQEQPPAVVIRRVFASTSSGSVQFNYVELFNASDLPVDIGGWSIQYTSGRGTDTLGARAQITVLPSFELAPGQSYLVQEAGAARPNAPVKPDLSGGTIVMNAVSGTLALVRSATPLGCNGASSPCSASQLAEIADLVGYGSSNFYRGAPVRVGTDVALSRYGHGCSRRNDHRTDFEFNYLETLRPSNSASRLDPCGIGEYGACTKLEIPSGVWTVAFPDDGVPECPDCKPDSNVPQVKIRPPCSGCLFSADSAFLYLDENAYASLLRTRRVFLRLATAGGSSAAATAVSHRIGVAPSELAPSGRKLDKHSSVLSSKGSTDTQESNICLDITGVFHTSTPGAGISLPALGGSGYRVTVGSEKSTAYIFFDVPDVTPPAITDDPG